MIYEIKRKYTKVCFTKHFFHNAIFEGISDSCNFFFVFSQSNSEAKTFHSTIKIKKEMTVPGLNLLKKK